MTLPLLPAPRLLRPRGDRISLTPRWSICVQEATAALDHAATTCAARLHARCGLALPRTGSGPAITLAIDPSRATDLLRDAGWSGTTPPAEGYVLTTSGTGIELIGTDAAGLFYAVQTLAQLCDLDGNVPGVDVRDYPALGMRGFQFDLGRQVERMDYALDVCRRMAELKMNTVFLYLENAVRYERHPAFAAPGAWTMDAMRDFIRQCATWHMDVIPIVPNLGHTGFIAAHPDYAHLSEGREGARNSYRHQSYCLCPSLPETRRLVEDMFEEWFAISPSPYFHISCDENHDLGLCSLCRPKYDAGGMAQVFFEHVNWAAELVVQAGKRPMLWGDQLLYWPERLGELHPAAIVMDWEYTTRLGRSLNAFMHWHAEDTTGLFIRGGHDVVLAPYGASSHTAQFLNAYGRQSGVLGTNATIWELSRNFFEVESTGLAFNAAAAWQGSAPPVAEFERAAAYARFGTTSDEACAIIDPANSRHRGAILGSLRSYIVPLPVDALSKVPTLARKLNQLHAFRAGCTGDEAERLACEAHVLARELFSTRLRETMSGWYQALRHPDRTPPQDTVTVLRDLLAENQRLQVEEARLWARYRPQEQQSSTLQLLTQLAGEMEGFLAQLQNEHTTDLACDFLVMHVTDVDLCFRRLEVEVAGADGVWQTVYAGHDGGDTHIRLRALPLPAGVAPSSTVRLSFYPHGEVGIRFVEILYADGRRAAPVAAVGAGCVRNPEYTLVDDMRVCWMNPDDVAATYLWFQHRPELMGPHTLTLTMAETPEYLCATGQPGGIVDAAH
jgi:hypothetical protein